MMLINISWLMPDQTKKCSDWLKKNRVPITFTVLYSQDKIMHCQVHYRTLCFQFILCDM